MGPGVGLRLGLVQLALHQVRVGPGPLVCGGDEAEAVAEEAGDGHCVVLAQRTRPRLLGVRGRVRIRIRVRVRVRVRGAGQRLLGVRARG